MRSFRKDVTRKLLTKWNGSLLFKFLIIKYLKFLQQPISNLFMEHLFVLFVSWQRSIVKLPVDINFTSYVSKNRSTKNLFVHNARAQTWTRYEFSVKHAIKKKVRSKLKCKVSHCKRCWIFVKLIVINA